MSRIPPPPPRTDIDKRTPDARRLNALVEAWRLNAIHVSTLRINFERILEPWEGPQP